MKTKITLLKMMSALLLQICSIIGGFIVPHIIINYFGSNVNGLVSSLNQFLSFISLLEGGITSVVMANLYKPLSQKNMDTISSIMVTAKKFFSQIGMIFIIYSLILAAVYPFCARGQFGYWYVFWLTIILSISLVIQYLFSISLRVLLEADKKVYIVSFTQCIIVVLNVILVYVCVRIFPSIHLLKLISGLVYILQPVVFFHIVSKKYNIDWNRHHDKSLIKERWSGFAINLAAFIHEGTDIAILTFCSNFEMISVYTVYALITNGLKQVVASLTSGINPSLGHSYAKGNLKEIHLKLDLYEYIIFSVVTFLFTVAMLLITPFVMIYTQGVRDADYYQPLFGIVFVMAEALYLLKFPHLNLAYSANKFREVTPYAYIEAIINILVSSILVWKFGLSGVAMGTFIAMLFRMAAHVYYTSKIVPTRRPSIFVYKLVIYVLGSVFSSLVCIYFAPIETYTIWQWIAHGVIYSVIVGVVILSISFCFFSKELKFFKNYIRRGGHK